MRARVLENAHMILKRTFINWIFWFASISSIFTVRGNLTVGHFIKTGPLEMLSKIEGAQPLRRSWDFNSISAQTSEVSTNQTSRSLNGDHVQVN